MVAREVPGARVEGDNDDHLQLNSVPDIMVIDKENDLNPINKANAGFLGSGDLGVNGIEGNTGADLLHEESMVSSVANYQWLIAGNCCDAESFGLPLKGLDKGNGLTRDVFKLGGPKQGPRWVRMSKPHYLRGECSGTTRRLVDEDDSAGENPVHPIPCDAFEFCCPTVVAK